MPKTNFRIAVVDDEESVRKALGRLIDSAGFDVQTFASGAEFLSSTRQKRPHCVLLDVRLPTMDGFEIQRQLMQEERPTPVVIITGADSPEYRTFALQQGAKAYLRKPIDAAVLVDAIESAILSLPPADD